MTTWDGSVLRDGAAEAAGHHGRVTQGTVLVLEDDDAIRRALALGLEDEGHQACEAALLDAEGRLVLGPRPLDRDEAEPATLVQAVLDELQRGPDDRDRSAGLGTALPSASRLLLSGLDDAVATVESVGLDDVPHPERLALAVALAVLSVTTVPGVTAVQLTKDGSEVDVPLLAGTTTSEPLTVDLVRGALGQDTG